MPPDVRIRTDVKSLFGQRVRDFRSRLAISQEELADRAGLDRTYVSSVERGHRNVSLENIVRLAMALGVDAGELMTGLGAAGAHSGGVPATQR